VLASVAVTALAPDIIQGNLGGANAQLQVNIFLHQVTYNPGWRNVGLPTLASDGATRLMNPPLALDLHYLLTVYATEDTQAEALLGYAVLMLHENPILPRSLIQTALSPANIPHTSPLTANPLFNVLTTTGLANQIEMIKISPSPLGREEIAWIWTALKSDYRPTFPFQVSVALIQPTLPSSFSLPVLSRNISIQAGPPPQLLAWQTPHQQSAHAPGNQVVVTGQALSGASLVVLTNGRLGIQYKPFAPVSTTPTSVTFTIPEDPANLPAGVYNLSMLFLDSTGNVTASTNLMPFPIAPRILLPFAPGTAVANSAGTLVTINCDPQVLPNQSVSLALGGASVPAQTFAAPTATLTFQFPTLSGPYLARLQVDGVDSPIQVKWHPPPPVFSGPFLTV
jgi:hypothetical protein